MSRRLLMAIRGAWLTCAFLIAAWFGLLLTHEAGHVLHAWVSGGRIEMVDVPLLGFSRTDLGRNPRPIFVAWGGFIWGALIPLGLLGLANVCWRRASRPLRGFAAVALLGNTAYACSAVGDVEDIIRAGGLRWPLFLFALLTAPVGLFLLERFIRASPLRALADPGWGWAVGMTAAAGVVAGGAVLVTFWTG